MMKKLLSLLISSASAEVIGGADAVTDIVYGGSWTIRVEALQIGVQSPFQRLNVMSPNCPCLRAIGIHKSLRSQKVGIH